MELKEMPLALDTKKTISLSVPSSFVVAVWGVAVVFLIGLLCKSHLKGLTF